VNEVDKRKSTTKWLRGKRYPKWGKIIPEIEEYLANKAPYESKVDFIRILNRLVPRAESCYSSTQSMYSSIVAAIGEGAFSDFECVNGRILYKGTVETNQEEQKQVDESLDKPIDTSVTVKFDSNRIFASLLVIAVIQIIELAILIY